MDNSMMSQPLQWRHAVELTHTITLKNVQFQTVLLFLFKRQQSAGNVLLIGVTKNSNSKRQ